MSDGRLAGRVAIVTGGAGGIGGATARRLSAEGAHVVVVDLDGDRAATVAESLPGEALAVAADVALEEDVERYAAAAVERFGRIDLHHLNAGIPGTLDAAARACPPPTSTACSRSTSAACSSGCAPPSGSSPHRAAAVRSSPPARSRACAGAPTSSPTTRPSTRSSA